MAEDVRLQKVIAAAGLASRRAAEDLISQGRVQVNGQVVDRLGARVDPETDVIRVDGSRLPPQRHHTYLVLNKPRGVVSTLDDPQGRPTLADYLPARAGRLFHVGRLDTDSEGLIVLTNDGDFAQRLAHPSFEIDKTYVAEVEGDVSPAVIKRLTGGVRLEDGFIRPDKVRLMSRAAGRSLLEISLHSGRYHIVRRLMAAVGHPVRRLSRIRIGPIKLGDLPVGQTRGLTQAELGALFDRTEKVS